MQLLLPILLFLAPPETDYGQAEAELQTAIDNSTGEDRKAAIAALTDAIARQGQYPDQASSTVPESVLEARAILVRLHLAEKNVQAAQEAMDELIRTAGDQTPPVRSYGREVTDLYEKRKAALQAAGMATLEIKCEVECDIVVDEHRTATASEDLLLGKYRIWVKAVGPDASWEYHEVELVEAGTVTTVVYKDPNPAPVEDTPPPPPPKKKRMLPRAAEIVGAVVGAGLLATGAVMLTLDGKCNKTWKDADLPGTTPDECGSVYGNTLPAGAALMAGGGGLLVISGVMLIVDEVRVGRAKGHQVMVGVTLRF